MISKVAFLCIWLSICHVTLTKCCDLSSTRLADKVLNDFTQTEPCQHNFNISILGWKTWQTSTGLDDTTDIFVDRISCNDTVCSNNVHSYPHPNKLLTAMFFLPGRSTEHSTEYSYILVDQKLFLSLIMNKTLEHWEQN